MSGLLTVRIREMEEGGEVVFCVKGHKIFPQMKKTQGFTTKNWKLFLYSWLLWTFIVIFLNWMCTQTDAARCATSAVHSLHWGMWRKKREHLWTSFIRRNAFQTRVLYLHTVIWVVHAYTPCSNKANCSSSNSMAPISAGGGRLVTHTDKGELGSRSGFYISI